MNKQVEAIHAAIKKYGVPPCVYVDTGEENQIFPANRSLENDKNICRKKEPSDSGT